ncbi:glycosyltransferase [bacterium]|nr:glycosyltransferase [bacterium]
MKILYVDLKFDYGEEKRGLNNIGQEGFIKAFINLGHDLEPFYYDSYLNNIEPLQKDLIQKADSYDPDLIFIALFTEQFKTETLDYLKSKFKTAAWFGDDNWRFDIYTKYLANHFTWCITTEKFALKKYHQIGQKNVIVSQWAAIDSYTLPERKERFLYDVSFVGQISSYRKWFIDYLRKKGVDVNVFGIGWPNGPVSSEEMNSIFMNSKINLNISNSESFDIRYLLHNPFRLSDMFSGDVKNKLRPVVAKGREIKKILFKSRGIKNIGSIKARTFEIPYFGGFQLSYYFPGIEDFFEIGKEIACYSGIDEAELLINYYLDDDVKRKDIANRSHKIALLKHGYSNRFGLILSQISTK